MTSWRPGRACFALQPLRVVLFCWLMMHVVNDNFGRTIETSSQRNSLIITDHLFNTLFTYEDSLESIRIKGHIFTFFLAFHKLTIGSVEKLQLFSRLKSELRLRASGVCTWWSLPSSRSSMVRRAVGGGLLRLQRAWRWCGILWVVGEGD